MAPDGNPDEFFGHAVALSEDFLFISANRKDQYDVGERPSQLNIGSVYIYKKSGNAWLFHEQLFAPDIVMHGSFGQEIACTNNYLAISEFAENGTGFKGYVHVYRRSGDSWARIATFRPSDIPDTDSFGRSIAMDDSTIVVGTGNTENDIRYDMKAYVFNRKGEWVSGTEDAILEQNTQMKLWWDRFGYSVALHDDVIVVGAPGWGEDTDFFGDQYARGAVFVFLKPPGGWKGVLKESARILPSDPIRDRSFGTSVAVNEDNIVVGAPHTYFDWNVVDNLNNEDGKILPGAIYHFLKRGSWTTTDQEDYKILSLNPEPQDMFGAKVIIEGGVIYVGAPQDDTESGHVTGSVQVRNLDPKIIAVETPCAEDGPVKLNAQPSGGLWSIEGYASQTEGQFSLAEGTYTAVYSINGCAAEQVFTVVSSDRVVDAVSPGQMGKCDYERAQIELRTNASEDQYFWYYKEHESDEYELVQQGYQRLEVTDAGYYLAEVRHPLCKPLIHNFTLIDFPAVNPVIGNTEIVCSDEPVQLTAQPEGGTWSSLANTEGVLDPSSLENGGFMVRYTIRTPEGCEYWDDEVVQIDKISQPAIEQVGESTCDGSPVMLYVNGPPTSVNTTIEWLSDRDPAAVLHTGPNFETTTPGTYFARLRLHSCFASSNPISVKVSPDSLFVPNVFTPNEDAKNDFFEISAEGIIDFRLTVANRYGKEIFSTREADFRWAGDGHPPGVYFWFIQYVTCMNEKKSLRGFVQLLSD